MSRSRNTTTCYEVHLQSTSIAGAPSGHKVEYTYTCVAREHASHTFYKDFCKFNTAAGAFIFDNFKRYNSAFGMRLYNPTSTRYSGWATHTIAVSHVFKTESEAKEFLESIKCQFTQTN